MKDTIPKLNPFVARYQRMPDDQLKGIAGTLNNLIPEARHALEEVMLQRGLVTEAFPPEPAEEIPVATKYPALCSIALALRLIAILNLLAGIGIAMFVIANLDSSFSLITGVGLIIEGIVGGVVIWAIAECIQVFMDIEENTRPPHLPVK